MEKCIPREEDTLIPEMRLKADGRDCVQRVVEAEERSVDVHWRADDDRTEFEEGTDEVLRHPRHGRVLPDERIHYRFRRDDLDSLRVQDLLEGPGIMVGVTVTDDNPLYAIARDALLLQFVEREARWIYHDPSKDSLARDVGDQRSSVHTFR